MSTQSQTKRNIFRSSLRRQFIESHQRQIRQKYLQYQQSIHIQSFANTNANTNNDVIKQLENILSMDVEYIMQIDNFQYFIRCLEELQECKDCRRKYGGIGDGGGYSGHEQYQYDLSNSRANNNQTLNHNNYTHNNNTLPYTNTPNQSPRNPRIAPISSPFQTTRMCQQFPQSTKKPSKISSIWFYKQRVYSLIYRILQKCLSAEKNQKLWYIIQRIVYLLEFPELMPLWQKISMTMDKKCKIYLCKEFSRKLSKSWCIQAISNCSIILDAQFVLDILINFITIQPIIDFQNCLQLLPFICYSLNLPSKYIQASKTFQFHLENEDCPKINKICIILRSMLQEDAKNRVNCIVQAGFEGLIGYLLGLAFEMKDSKMIEKNKYIDMKIGYEGRYCVQNDGGGSKRLQCGYMPNSKTRNSQLHITKPASPQIITKTNLIKLINRLFLTHPQLTSYILTKHNQTNTIQKLINQCSNLNCNQYNINNNNKSNAYSKKQSEKRKYLYVILCDSHRIYKKCMLTTLCTMFSVGSGDRLYVREFLGGGGLAMMGEMIGGESREFVREIAGIMAAVEIYLCREDTHKIDQQICIKFAEIQVELVSCWGQVYLSYQQLPHYQDISISHILQIRPLLPKLLKQCRNILLSYYARATQPQIFKTCSSLYLYGTICDILQQLSLNSTPNTSIHSSRGDWQLSDQNQISEYSRQILQICRDPIKYMQEFGSGYQGRFSCNQ